MGDDEGQPGALGRQVLERGKKKKGEGGGKGDEGRRRQGA